MSEHDALSTEVMDALVQASFTVMAALSQVAAAHEMSLTQLRVLAILRDHEPKIAELAAHLGQDRSSVSGLVDRSVRRGLIRRTRSTEDARAVQVTLTAQGQSLAAEITAQIADLVVPLIQRLNATEQKRLSALLGRLLDEQIGQVAAG
ncbi:MarR family winged helix-turn-helix transcriptional regulator [Nocardia alni]|uniref:MarR family winged helix-turn-helix transcriptional regulator n=1 Tax=Nocardia alni TaxID=2815723 RepID=UPI0020B4460F|nr:MarR family transcriptional regulator [Nocardia alni]